MKKILSVALLSGVLATSVFAKDSNDMMMQQGGFTGPTRAVAIDTVQKALAIHFFDFEEQKFLITGYFVKGLGDEKYLFKDGSGEIVAEVDDKRWRDLQVTPQTKVTIAGEIEEGWRSNELDVKRIRLAQ